MLLVVAAFASIVANTFMATFTEAGEVDYAASAANASTAMISILFIVISIVFGILVYRRNAPLGVSTVIGVVAIILCMVIGLNFHPFYLSNQAWMIIVGIYILVASVTPVWILLQPRDYLSSFLLYFMMGVAVIGIIGAGITGNASLDIPAFTGFTDTLAPTGASLGNIFPALFITIACGAISGFHSLVGSGTTAKQLDNEKDAWPIAYGGMLIECALALISLCAVGYVWQRYSGGELVVPTNVFATAITVVLGVALGMTGYANVWPLFGAANQLLAALGLMAVATWLGKMGKNNKMFFIPMAFMLIVTITSLCQTILKNFGNVTAGADTMWSAIRLVISILLVVLAIVIAVDSVKTLAEQGKEK